MLKIKMSIFFVLGIFFLSLTSNVWAEDFDIRTVDDFIERKDYRPKMAVNIKSMGDGSGG